MIKTDTSDAPVVVDPSVCTVRIASRSRKHLDSRVPTHYLIGTHHDSAHRLYPREVTRSHGRLPGQGPRAPRGW